MPRLIPTALPYVSTQSTFLSWTLHTVSEFEIVLVILSISRAASVSRQRAGGVQDNHRWLSKSGVEVGRGMANRGWYPLRLARGR